MNPGERLGRYDVLGLIGRGGMGVVYRARDTRLGREVAVKTLVPAATADPIARARFEREARAVAALSHPNIVAIYDVGDADGTLYVVTELLQGQTLGARLRDGPLAADLAHDYALQLARGLAAAHAKAILHRDLKPANVFVTPEGTVKILDFGIAVMQGEVPSSDEATLAGLHTRPGVLLGTPGYMPPEQLRQQAVDHRADLFAWGAVVYEMLSGQRPFDGASVADIVTAVLTNDPRPIGSQEPLAARLEHIAVRCLSKQPAHRYQSVDQVIGALTDAVTQSAPAGPAAPSPSSQPSIAVLPFADLSADRQLGYLGDGIADEITNGLARIAGLRVAARTSAFQFRGAVDDVRRIGRALQVDTVLEGSLRAAGTRLRVTTQLVNAADGYQLWSERFDRESGDVFAIEDEIAQAVVAALGSRLVAAPAPEALARGTRDVEAYTRYLKGRHLWNRRREEDLRAAVREFQGAIDRDPAYADAYGGLADVFVTLGIYGVTRPDDVMPRARAAADRAIALGATVPGVLATRATVAAVYDWQWVDADAMFQQAARDHPSHPTTLQWYATSCLLPTNRFEAAEAALRRALELDPLSRIIAVSLGLSALCARRYDEAAKRLHDALALDADFMMGQFFLGQVLARLGRHTEAADTLERALALSGGSPDVRSQLGCAYAAAGRQDEARSVLRDLTAAAAARYVSPTLAARVHAGLAEVDAALDALEAAADQRSADVIWIGVSDAFDPLRGHPRFEALVRRVGVGR
jgi:serine/threonine-protein kinase